MLRISTYLDMIFFFSSRRRHTRFDCDWSSDVCRKLGSQLPLSYIQIAHAGSAAAKNSGLAAARGKLIVFSDDDDIADAGLLRAHLAAHAEHPAPTVAILGFGKWHPELTLTPLMHYATEV